MNNKLKNTLIGTGITLVMATTATTAGISLLGDNDAPQIVEETIENIPSDTTLALIKDGIVANVVVVPQGWPNVPNAWQPPHGYEVVMSANAGIGYQYKDGKWIRGF